MDKGAGASSFIGVSVDTTGCCRGDRIGCVNGEVMADAVSGRSSGLSKAPHVVRFGPSAPEQVRPKEVSGDEGTGTQGLIL